MAATLRASSLMDARFRWRVFFNRPIYQARAEGISIAGRGNSRLHVDVYIYIYRGQSQPTTPLQPRILLERHRNRATCGIRLNMSKRS
jgi:hypothetical protein